MSRAQNLLRGPWLVPITLNRLRANGPDTRLEAARVFHLNGLPIDLAPKAVRFRSGTGFHAGARASDRNARVVLPIPRHSEVRRHNRVAVPTHGRGCRRGPKVYALHAPEVECIGKGKAQ